MLTIRKGAEFCCKKLQRHKFSQTIEKPETIADKIHTLSSTARLLMAAIEIQVEVIM